MSVEATRVRFNVLHYVYGTFGEARLAILALPEVEGIALCEDTEVWETLCELPTE